MYSIKFMKPIVLRKSLDDMTEKQKEQALRLLHNTDLLIIDKGGLKIVPEKEAKDIRLCFYGSEAVCVYREMLGLPDVGIRSIDVNDIVQAVTDYDCLIDIIYLLHRVDMRNDRCNRLSEMSAPTVIMMNEYRMLREYVETLQDNNWCGHPLVCCYDIEDDDGNPEHCEDVRQSLSDVGYDLLTGKKYAVETD